MVSFVGPLLGSVPPGTDRRAAGAGEDDAVGVGAHCTDYEDEARTVRS